MFAGTGTVAGLTQVELVDYLQKADTRWFENDSCQRVRINVDLVPKNVQGAIRVFYSCSTRILETHDLTYWVFETQDKAIDHFSELQGRVTEELGSAKFILPGGQEEDDGATVSIFTNDFMRSTHIVARAQNVVLLVEVDGGNKSDSEYHFLFGHGLLSDGLNNLYRAKG